MYQSKREELSVSYEGDGISADDAEYLQKKLDEQRDAFSKFGKERKCPYFNDYLYNCCPECAAYREARIVVRLSIGLGDWKGPGGYHLVMEPNCEKGVFYGIEAK